MATEKELLQDVNDYWIGWNQKGPETREYDIEDGNMRTKCREFVARKEDVDSRVSEYDKIRLKYKRQEK
jgi:hypothetical protein